MPPHPLTNFEIQKHFKNKPRFSSVYSRDNLPDKIKNGAYIHCMFIMKMLLILMVLE